MMCVVRPPVLLALFGAIFNKEPMKFGARNVVNDEDKRQAEATQSESPVSKKKATQREFIQNILFGGYHWGLSVLLFKELLLLLNPPPPSKKYYSTYIYIYI